MTNGGIYTLGDFALTTSAVYVGDAIENLDGMTAATVQLRFQYGSGGTTVRAYCQVSADQGTTWCDVICVLYGTSSEVAIFNLSGLTPKTTAVVPTDGALTDDTAIDGILADRMRLKVVVTGTYAGQTVLSGRVSVR